MKSDKEGNQKVYVLDIDRPEDATELLPVADTVFKLPVSNSFDFLQIVEGKRDNDNAQMLEYNKLEMEHPQEANFPKVDNLLASTDNATTGLNGTITTLTQNNASEAYFSEAPSDLPEFSLGGRQCSGYTTDVLSSPFPSSANSGFQSLNTKSNFPLDTVNPTINNQENCSSSHQPTTTTVPFVHSVHVHECHDHAPPFVITNTINPPQSISSTSIFSILNNATAYSSNLHTPPPPKNLIFAN